MQGYTIAPRAGLFTDDQIEDVLASATSVGADLGMRVVDVNGNILADITDSFVLDGNNKIERNNYAEIHGTCQLTTDYPLQWGVDLIEPYMQLSSIKTNNLLTADQQTGGHDTPLRETSTRTNLAPNPHPSTSPAYPLTNGGWGVTTGGGSNAVSTTQFRTGGESVKYTSGGSGSQGCNPSHPTAVVVGHTYKVSVWVYVPSGTPTVDLQSLTGNSHGDVSSVLNAWQKLTMTWVPQTTTEVFTVFSSFSASGQVFYVSDVLIEDAVATFGDYFTGDFTDTAVDTYAWVGTAGNSSSTDIKLSAALPDGVLIGAYGCHVDVDQEGYWTALPNSGGNLRDIHGLGGWSVTPGYEYSVFCDVSEMAPFLHATVNMKLVFKDSFGTVLSTTTGPTRKLTMLDPAVFAPMAGATAFAPAGAVRGEAWIQAVSTGGFLLTDRWAVAQYPELPGPVFNLGHFVATSPTDMQLRDDLIAFAFTGYDKLYLLDIPVGKTFVASANHNVLGLVSSIITSNAHAGGLIDLDQTGSTKVLIRTKNYVFDSEHQWTWLGIINDLLGMIGYRGLWCDQDGYFRSGPYVSPIGRHVEAYLDVADPTTILEPDRSVANDQYGVPNKWIYINTNVTGTPVEGNGKYTYTNDDVGPSSVDAIGHENPDIQFVSATSQADLVTQATKAIDAALAATEVFTVSTSLLPIAGHFDVIEYIDPAISGGQRKCQAQSWSMPLDAPDARMTWVLEGVDTPTYTLYGQQLSSSEVVGA